ncbi:retrovirus-related Pol polyprotein from transposon 412 [Trichonephila clavipes]|nr:retrovirus-related Pol polyprotein from transposon 412 [Trichonephila clavipes]
METTLQKRKKQLVAFRLTFSWIHIVRQLVLDLLYGLLPNPSNIFDITLTDDEPIFHKPRRLPFAERDIVDAQVDEWVKNGIVEPCSSPYASQVVVVKKKDGKSRVCIDYRRLNRKLIKDNYLLPLIDEILDCLQNAKIFTTLDLKNGVFHATVNERSRKCTSFVTHNAQYQFRRMPFGLSTCPSTFMRYINTIFRYLISKSIVLPYTDDVVVPAAPKHLNI